MPENETEDGLGTCQRGKEIGRGEGGKQREDREGET